MLLIVYTYISEIARNSCSFEHVNFFANPLFLNLPNFNINKILKEVSDIPPFSFAFGHTNLQPLGFVNAVVSRLDLKGYCFISILK